MNRLFHYLNLFQNPILVRNFHIYLFILLVLHCRNKIDFIKIYLFYSIIKITNMGYYINNELLVFTKLHIFLWFDS
jgi:hypothetical protein